MTIAYSADLAEKHTIPSNFVRLLKRWRGSIYKLIYCDLIIYIAIYYMIKLSYIFLMTEPQKESFEDVVNYFSQYHTKIPIMFVLGFYVSIVVSRWSSQIKAIPWPDPVAVFVSCLIRGNDDHGRKMRRTVMRYLCLAFIMAFRLISPKVIKRFPTYDSLIDAGVLNENEKKIIQAIDDIYPKQPKYWMPIVWTSSILTRARQEGRIRDDFALRTLNEAINMFRHNCMTLLHYDTISIPLVYTQVVALAVYCYVAASAIGSQWVDKDRRHTYVYELNFLPIFSLLEFIFFMGWLKVAETLICPYGYDDDDFEVNAIIDRNLVISYLVVDEMHNRHPTLIKDQYWDDIYPIELPGSSAPPEHSTAHLDPKNSEIDAQEQEPKPILKRRRHSTESEQESTYEDDDDDDDETDREIKFERLSENPMLQSRSSSMITVQDCMLTDLEEIEFEEYEEEENDDDLEPFEKLRRQRGRERIQRQHQKVQRTVENVAEVAADLPINNIRLIKIESDERVTDGGSTIKIKKKTSSDEVKKKED